MCSEGGHIHACKRLPYSRPGWYESVKTSHFGQVDLSRAEEYGGPMPTKGGQAHRHLSTPAEVGAQSSQEAHTLDDFDFDAGSDAQDQQNAYREFGGPSPYCKHGTFVGGSSGPDYMCGYCEMGTSDEEFAQMRLEEQRREALDEVQHTLAAAMIVVSKANVLNQHDHLLTSIAQAYTSLERLKEPEHFAREREESLREDPPGAVAVVGTPAPRRDYMAELNALKQEPVE